jgi:hypothetical protein
MPLELGIAMARRFMDPSREHDWLALVPRGHSYLMFISDLAAYDPGRRHSGGHGLAGNAERAHSRDYSADCVGGLAGVSNRKARPLLRLGWDPIGRVIPGDWANPRPTEIIGVAGDIRHNGLTAEPRPTVFLAQSQTPGYYTFIIIRTALDPTVV